MDTKKVAQTIKELYASQLRVPVKDISYRTTYWELGVDNVEFAHLIISLETEFGITLPTNKVCKLKTIGQTINLVTKTLGNKGGTRLFRQRG